MNRKKLKFGTIADPIEKFHPQAETTFFILKEITRRGSESWIMEPKALFIEDSRLFAHARLVKVQEKKKRFSYQLGPITKINLVSLDILFLRKDPPVDVAYINHLTLLELVGAGSPRPGRGNRAPTPFFINSPSGIKKASEKIYPLLFPRFSPPTMITSSKSVASEFVKKHKKVVLKPLNEGGGRGIFLLSHGDPKNGNILKKSTHHFSVHVVLQKYLPQAKKGDKRILLIGGTPLGAFLRIPKKGEFRANLHQGGSFVKSAVTAHERKIIRRLKTPLNRLGLYFVGLDIIGRSVTEINVTSPMGIREINHCENSQIEKKILNWAIFHRAG